MDLGFGDRLSTAAAKFIASRPELARVPVHGSDPDRCLARLTTGRFQLCHCGPNGDLQLAFRDRFEQHSGGMTELDPRGCRGLLRSGDEDHA